MARKLTLTIVVLTLFATVMSIGVLAVFTDTEVSRCNFYWREKAGKR